MENEIILLDTSILIEYFRKKDKSKSVLFAIYKDRYILSVSSITEFEILRGSNETQSSFWKEMLSEIIVFPFDSEAAHTASNLDRKLKKQRKQIDIPDLFIAAIAVKNGLRLATLNKKHFNRVEGLKLLELS